MSGEPALQEQPILTLEEMAPFKHPPLLPLIKFLECLLLFLTTYTISLLSHEKDFFCKKKCQYSQSVMKSKICREQMRLHTINYPAPTCGKWLSSSSNASSPIGLLKNKSCGKKYWLNACLVKTCCSLTL